MFLSDTDIWARLCKGDLKVEPYSNGALQPASLDVRLSPTIKVLSTLEPLDPLRSNDGFFIAVDLEAYKDRPFILKPGMFVLGSTLEHVTIPNDLICRIEGVSSNGRNAIVVHATAGYVDPGFRGNLTLEMSTWAPRGVLLRPNMRIAQLSFAELRTPATTPYNGRYQGQTQPEGARA